MSNTVYPVKAVVTDAQTLKFAVMFDHVCAAYKNSHRANSDFIESNCLPLDLDNAPSNPKAEDTPPELWKSPEDVRAAFPGVIFYTVTSRNHLKPKDGRLPRPKHHYYFPIDTVTDAEDYAAMKRRAWKHFPYFDDNALCAARFFFGTEEPKVEYYDGEISIAEFLRGLGDTVPVPLGGRCTHNTTENTAAAESDVIHKGNRNSSLSKKAGRLLKRHGDTDKAREAFYSEAAKCNPPLSTGELDTIYKSAQGFLHNTVEKQPGYVAPEQYKGNVPCFIYFDGNEKPRVSAPSLAALFAKEHPYKIVSGAGDPKIYLYKDGVYREAINIEVEKILADYVYAFNPQLLNPGKIAEAHKDLYLTGDHLSIRDFDTDEALICFKNCLYDFISRERHPHSPDKLFTVQLDSELPDEAAPTPTIDRYMADLMKGNPDGERLIYEFSGLAFSNVKGFLFKKALFMIGRGNSGKTQIKQLAERIVGRDNFNNTDLSTLETSKFASAGFQGKRLCGSNDMSFMRAPEINTFKQLTGGDNIDAERKFESSYSFRYDGVLWFVGNQLPLFGGDKGDHVYDRIIPLRCDNVIPKNKQVKNLCDLMFAERGGFILKALEAARGAVLNNYTLTIPKDSEAVLERYKTDNSEIKQFVEEWTLPHDGVYKKNHNTAAVFKAYERWCVLANAKVRLSKGMFKRELFQALGMPADSEVVHKSTGNFFPVMLTDAALEEINGFFL
ncbi:MAG: DUF5906 domain-containing protein [Clostridiales bacterium]|nr:DUF5906 domain-containing protein [Clostridiales bacterium]